ncbi:MAG: response regulator transcription factor [Isosphaeraceae bacterium]
MPKILIVEDEDKLRRALARGLADAGYDVEAVDHGEDGLALALEGGFDALVLDRMLPGRDGLQILDALRNAGLATPVLMLSARGEVEDRVRGLDAGADDYLAKPFAWTELLARLRACLRRRAEGESTLLKVGDIGLDRARRRLVGPGGEVELTVRESELLDYLMRRAGRVAGRDDLARDVWGDPGAVVTNVIDVFVNQVRKKLDRAGAPGAIRTVRGAGYAFDEP